MFLLQTDPYVPKPSLRALREAGTLADAGWDVSFVSWIKGHDVSPAESRFPVTRIRMPVPPLGSSFIRRAMTYIRATTAVARATTAVRPDLLVAHDLEILRAAVQAHRRTGAPILYDSHEDWPALIAENSSLEGWSAQIQERRHCRHVAQVLTVSDPIASKFRAMGKPVTVLYNARPSAEVQRAERDVSRAGFGYAPSDFVVGFAGAVVPGRGLEVLLDAIGELPRPVKALVVGGPQEGVDGLRLRVESMGLRDRVRIDGYRPFEELAPYYASMDLGVILLDRRPNHQRALPNKLFDYMAHGVPVLVPDYPVMESVVRESDSGWSVESVEREALVKILPQIQTSDERVVRGENGRRAFLEWFSWDKQEATFSKIVDALVGNR